MSNDTTHRYFPLIGVLGDGSPPDADPPPLAGLATHDAEGGELLDVNTRGAVAQDPRDRETQKNVSRLLTLARAAGLELPQGFAFGAGEVFYEGRRLVEVRLRGWVVNGERATKWVRSIAIGSSPTEAGPRFEVRDGGIVMADEDRARTFMAAVIVGTADGGRLLVSWDLHENVAGESTRPQHPGEAAAEPGPVDALAASVFASFSRVPDVMLGGLQALARGTPRRAERLPLAAHDGGTFSIVPGFRHWVLVPPRGYQVQIALPFNENEGYEQEGGVFKGIKTDRAGELARRLLSEGRLVAYLTAWALWETAGADRTGVFRLDPELVADLRGFQKTGGGRADGGGSYGRPWQDFKKDLAFLQQIGLSEVGDGENWARAAVPEPLINAYAFGDTAGPRDVMFKHAGLAIAWILGQRPRFVQVPRAVLRLDARDAPMAYGLAAMWRAEIHDCALAPGAPGVWRGNLLDVLSATGMHNPRDAGKKGREYWEGRAEALGRVMNEGGFGVAHVEGAGSTARVTLEPSPLLAAAYKGLLEARARAATRDEEVRIRVSTEKALGRGGRAPRKGSKK
jgi:hypothetical protein